MKLEKVIDLIKCVLPLTPRTNQSILHCRNQIPKDERVLIFVQFPDLMKKLAEALTAHKVRFLEIKGSATQKSNNLEKYQNDSAERVLLLNVMDESASGANLTSANHAIFLSPLLAPTKEIYDANETQAVGRLVRYGQMKHVYVWRFLTKNTIDEEIYQQRAKDKKTM
jgi:SNF2 family DNA or RNA helicase